MNQQPQSIAITDPQLRALGGLSSGKQPVLITQDLGFDIQVLRSDGRRWKINAHGKTTPLETQEAKQ